MVSDREHAKYLQAVLEDSVEAALGMGAANVVGRCVCQPPRSGSAQRTLSGERSISDVLDARRSGGIDGHGVLHQDAVLGVLRAATGSPDSRPHDSDIPSVEVWLTAMRVQGLRSGAYRYSDDKFIWLDVVNEQYFRDSVMLQRDHGQAAAILFLAAPLFHWLQAYGDAGYKFAALESGWLLDRLYIAAEAYGLSYSASTGFCLHAVDAMFAPRSASATAMVSFVLSSREIVATRQK